MQNLEAEVSQASLKPALTILVPFPDISFDSNVEDAKALEYCMKVIETMMTMPKNGCQKSVSMLLGRKQDPYLGMPPEALYEVFPVLFDDTMKAMKFLRLYSYLHHSPFTYNVSTGFNEAVNDIRYFAPLAVVVFKLYDASRWFKELPPEERMKKLLQKGVVESTLIGIMEPMLLELEKEGKDAKVVIYGPNEAAKYTTTYDALRAAMIEEGIFKKLEQMFGKHPQIMLRRDRHINNAVELLKGMDYSN